MRKIILCFVSSFVLNAWALEDAEFQKKLTQVLARAEKSEKLLRQQIVESQTAPFLPDLYLQLAQLLSEKSNALYYLQMEKSKGSGVSATEKEFSPVISAQREAIRVYRTLAKDFPKFDRRKQVLYRMALSLKSIDENAEFMKTAGMLLKEYPGTEEEMGTRLLLGQQYYDGGHFEDATGLFAPVTISKFPYERNLARYRLGLIAIAKEKYKEALTRFESVVTDSELKEQENPYDVSIKSKRGKTDLKREALIDSVRTFTHVFEKDADPVGYYSKLAPTEAHFQEVIEKLSLRYIHLKKYDAAIKLLRTLSERTAEPVKIVNIYQEVMQMIPIKDRVYFPVEEMRFVLEKYNLWTSYYTIAPGVQDTSYLFFEKQVREMATTSHQLAKEAKGPDQKSILMGRARDYYLLYLAYFRKTKDSAKMATNLADVYFSFQDYLSSGDYYVRAFSGEFGPAAEKKLLVENAILCLQKKVADGSYYESIRRRGLLIRAIESYLSAYAAKKKDSALGFLLVKTYYEQGFFPESLEKLLAYMKEFPSDSKSVDAGELILDYFNTRNDFTGLTTWSQKILALKLPQPAFNKKVVHVAELAKSKSIQEQVRTLSGYDEFSQGKGYLSVALRSNDEALKNLALQEALAKSRREKDIQTFLRAASLMADKEKNLGKRSEILLSIAREHLRVAHFYQAISQFRTIAKPEAQEEAISVALMLRDWDLLAQLLRESKGRGLTPATQQRLKENLSELAESSDRISPDVLLSFLNVDPSFIGSLFKAQSRFPVKDKPRLRQEIENFCGKSPKEPACLWEQLEAVDGERVAWLKKLGTAAPSMETIPPLASGLLNITENYKRLENNKDPHLETVLSLRNAEVFGAFGQFLAKGANENAELKPVLLQKAKETNVTAKSYRDRCRLLSEKTQSVNPALIPCLLGRSPPLSDLLRWNTSVTYRAPGKDPKSEKLANLEQAVFGAKEKEGATPLLNLAREYWSQKEFSHAAATAAFGMAAFQSQARDFQAVLGCSVLEQGFYGEANFHLKSASAFEGMSERCLKQLNGILNPPVG